MYNRNGLGINIKMNDILKFHIWDILTFRDDKYSNKKLVQFSLAPTISGGETPFVDQISSSNIIIVAVAV